MPTVQHAIDVAGSPDDCWRVFSDLSTWTRWFPMLAAVDGELAAGGHLRLTFAAGPARLPVDVRIEEFRPRALVRWIGGRLGVRGDHSYTFDVNIEGITRVTSRESFSGIGARLVRGPIFDKLDGETHESMARFKALVEGSQRVAT